MWRIQPSCPVPGKVTFWPALSLASHLRPVAMGDPARGGCPGQHSAQDHWATQTPPPRSGGGSRRRTFSQRVYVADNLSENGTPLNSNHRCRASTVTRGSELRTYSSLTAAPCQLERPSRTKSTTWTEISSPLAAPGLTLHCVVTTADTAPDGCAGTAPSVKLDEKRWMLHQRRSA